MPKNPYKTIDEARKEFSMAYSRPQSSKSMELLTELAYRPDWAKDPSIRKFALSILDAQITSLSSSEVHQKALKILVANSGNKIDGLANLIGKDPSCTVEAMILMEDGSPNSLCESILRVFSTKAFGNDIAKRNRIVDAMIAIGRKPYGDWSNSYSGRVLAESGNILRWGSYHRNLLEGMNSFPTEYAIPFISNPGSWKDLASRVSLVVESNVLSAQDAHLLLETLPSDERAKRAYSFMTNPSVSSEEKKRLFILYSLPSHQNDSFLQDLLNTRETFIAIFKAMAQSSDKSLYEIALKSFLEKPSKDTVEFITGNLNWSIENSDKLFNVIKKDPDLMSHADPYFVSFVMTLKEFDAVDIDTNGFKTSSWYRKHLIVEAEVFDWKSLSDTGKAAFKAFILISIGIPIGMALLDSGISGSQLEAHKDLAKPAAQMVKMKDSSQEYKSIVDSVLETSKRSQPMDKKDVTAPKSQPEQEFSETWKKLERQKLNTKIIPEQAGNGKANITDEEASMIAERADMYAYLRKRMGEKEYLIISQVADEAGLDPLQKKLLLSIRIIENGRPGKEMGQGDWQPSSKELKAMWDRVEKENGAWKGNPEAKNKHPARRYEGNFEKSLRLQAQWAAGTIKKRFDGSIASFAQRYCRSNWINWFQLSKNFLLSTESRES